MSAVRTVIGVLITATTLLDHTPVAATLATSSTATDTHIHERIKVDYWSGLIITAPLLNRC